MELVEWNDSFSVGNALMDAHHQVFFQMIKEFREVPNKGDRDVMKKYVDFLVEYTAMHLGSEEALMHQAGYPELDRHKAVHDAFTRKVLSVAESFDHEQASISADDILKIIEDWLVGHILDEDKRYMPYVEKLAA